MGGEVAAFVEGLFECGRRLVAILVLVAVNMEWPGIAALLAYCGLWIGEMVGLVFRAGFRRWGCSKRRGLWVREWVGLMVWAVFRGWRLRNWGWRRRRGDGRELLDSTLVADEEGMAVAVRGDK